MTPTESLTTLDVIRGKIKFYSKKKFCQVIKLILNEKVHKTEER